MTFGMIILNQNMVKKQNCVTWMQVYGFILYIKTGDVLKDIAEDVEIRFYTLNY